MGKRTREELETDLDQALAAPADGGELELVVRRPGVGERELLERAELDLEVGVIGDTWFDRDSSRNAEGEIDTASQVTIMSARAARLVAGSDDHTDWAAAGDQLYVDLDLSVANLPPGARLGIGKTVVEVMPEPHLGCGKFLRRFGVDAMKLVNSEIGRAARLRGVNVRVIGPGEVSPGDRVRKL